VAATKVDFYLLGTAELRARLATACRLAEKAYEHGLKVAVRTSSPGESVELDELMWTFADRSFVPHGLWPAEPDFAAATPVLIGHGALPASHRDVLINLAADAPVDLSGYSRICEVVGGEADDRHRARLRWREYRDAGCRPEKHDL